MLEELQRRNFAPSTIRGYIRTVRDFAAYFHTPPDQLGPKELSQFQLHLLRDRKLATGTVQNRMTALRCPNRQPDSVGGARSGANP
jgi:hypothetical protein